MSLFRTIFAFENGREVANLVLVFTECLHSGFALGSLCLRFRKREQRGKKRKGRGKEKELRIWLLNVLTCECVCHLTNESTN